MAITRLLLKNFTAFEEMDLEPSPGMNVFVGANGTGKTHLMKVIYSACDIIKTKRNFAEKLIRNFLPSGNALGRLVKRQKTSATCAIEVHRDTLKLHASFSNHTTAAESATIKGGEKWSSTPVECVYIPVKEMLSNAQGFRSLHNQRDVHFEEIYADILDRAFRPVLRGPVDASRKKLLHILQKKIEGKVTLKDEKVFLKNKQGNLEFSLLAEGMRKLGLLWLLIQNGTLLNGSILFWDEPETNLNPSLFGTLIEILLELQRNGVQIFLATHDYVILKEIDLKKKENDEIMFHALYRDKQSGQIRNRPTSDYLDIHPNAIADTFSNLYDREIERSLGGSAK